MVLISVDSDFEECANGSCSPTTSETGEIFLYKIKNKTSLNPDESHQEEILEPCSPRSRITSSDFEISLLLDKFYSKEPGFDPLHDPKGRLSLNELLIMEDERREEYPTIFKYPDLFEYVPSEKRNVKKPKAPFIGNLFNPNRRLDIYREFVRHLYSSDFPFSALQKKFLKELRNQVRSLHKLSKECEEDLFVKYRDEEIDLKTDLESFVSYLPHIDDKEFSQVRINRYVAAMIFELEFWIESKKPNPISKYGDRDFFYFDPASFLIKRLTEVFPDSTEERIDKNFFAKRKEVYSELVRILTESKFPFTNPQRKVIREISENLKFTIGNPDAEEDLSFQDLVSKLLFELNYRDDGPRDGISNTKKVRRALVKLMDDIGDLQKREREMLSDFEVFSIHSADLLWMVKETLNLSFFPRHFWNLVVDPV